MDYNKIRIRQKKNYGAYQTKYVSTKASSIKCPDSAQYDNLAELYQDSVNKMYASHCTFWQRKKMPDMPEDMDLFEMSVCNEDAFYAILCPYNTNTNHYMYIWYSIDSGDTWNLYKHLNNNALTQINSIRDVVAYRDGSSYSILCIGSPASYEPASRIYALDVDIYNGDVFAYIPYIDNAGQNMDIQKICKTKNAIYLLNLLPDEHSSDEKFLYRMFLSDAQHKTGWKDNPRSYTFSAIDSFLDDLMPNYLGYRNLLLHYSYMFNKFVITFYDPNVESYRVYLAGADNISTYYESSELIKYIHFYVEALDNVFLACRRVGDEDNIYITCPCLSDTQPRQLIWRDMHEMTMTDFQHVKVMFGSPYSMYIIRDDGNVDVISYVRGGNHVIRYSSGTYEFDNGYFVSLSGLKLSRRNTSAWFVMSNNGSVIGFVVHVGIDNIQVSIIKTNALSLSANAGNTF